MPRFYVKNKMVQEGQKHSDTLFATDSESTVRHWLNMYEEFYVFDSISGKAMRNEDDLNYALSIAPVQARVQWQDDITDL